MPLRNNKFFSALVLEAMLPPTFRKHLKRVIRVGIFVACLGIGYAIIQIYQKTIFPALVLPQAPLHPRIFIGIIFVLASIRLLLAALESFWHSHTLDTAGNSNADDIAMRCNFYAASLLFAARPLSPIVQTSTSRNMLTALPKTTAGQAVLARLGIAEAAYQKFLNAYTGNGMPLQTVLQQCPPTTEITFGSLLVALAASDEQFKALLASHKITLAHMEGATRWVETQLHQQQMAQRWWQRASLGRIPGIGKSWAYGYTLFLEQFARPIRIDPGTRLIGKDREIKLVEAALLKGSGANVLIVGEPGTGKRTVLEGLTRMIEQGTIFPELEHKKILELAGSSLIATGKTKGETEGLLVRLLNEAAKAGDVILAIEDFPEFIQSLANTGIAGNATLSPYLASTAIHLLCLANVSSFRKILEKDAGLLQHFEIIRLQEPNTAHLIEILQDVLPAMEAARNRSVIVTYSALAQIAQGAARYLVQGGLPERAVGLLEESLGEAAALGEQFCTPELVLDILESKTKMPLGQISAVEQDKLLHLEEHLHQRVIGQNKAIDAIANAVRRARANIAEVKRPIGSFLFLGPTGVGKTETAKALAAVYFGSEEAFVRFDMTEYQGEESLSRLIGSFERNEPGMLASALRAAPYAIVLLDEFEKSNSKVRDLFLQILDEGFFTDAFGDTINMRNTIIIATSNAGALMIADAVSKVTSLEIIKEQIVSFITQQGIFKPELLNRFDGTIIFEPLGEQELAKIARLLLERLVARLAEQNITLAITDPLITAVVKGGYNPLFGARPMRRFIQDKIEKIIAEKLIRQEIASGSTVTIAPEELELD